jgi:glycine cleavage system H lipoate-binding protein
MKKSTGNNLYYTVDYEWIDFQGAIAYVGVCSFKLTGFKEVQQLIFNDAPGSRKKGEVIAPIKYHE